MRFLSIILFLFTSGLANAQDVANSSESSLRKEMRQLADDLDRQDGVLRADIERLRTDFDRLSREFSNFDQDYSELDSFLARAGSIDSRITALESSIGSISKSAANAEAISSSMRWIVTIVSILITAMSVVFGLLFSQRFLNLQSDARVAHEVLARIEKSMDQTKSSDIAVLRDTIATLKGWIEEQKGQDDNLN